VLFFGFLLLIAYYFPPLFQSHALVLVKPGRESSPQSFVPVSSMPPGNISTTLEDVNSEVAIMTSRPVLLEVAQRIVAERQEKPENFFTRFQDWCRSVGLLPDLDPVQNLVLGLQDKIEPEPLPLSHVIELEYTSFDAKNAFKTLDYLLDAYVKHHGKVHSTPEALEFFKGQAEEFRKKLDDVNARLTKFRVENDGGDLTLKRSLLLQELATTESQRRALEHIPEGSEELASASVADNPQVADSRKRLLDLRIELSQKLDSFGEQSREVKAVHLQVDVVTKDLRDLLIRLHSVLADSETEMRAELQQVELLRATFDQLVAEQTELKTNHDTYVRKAEEERISQAMDADEMVSIRIVERPVVPVKPWFPARFILALLGIVLGIPGAISAALLRAYLAGRVTTVLDVEEKLRVPVLASVPRIPFWKVWRDRRAPMRDAARIVLASLQRQTEAGEQDGARVVHVAASSSREGARAFAGALARAASEAGVGEIAFVDLGEQPGSRRNGAAADVDSLLARAKPVEGAPHLAFLDLSDQHLIALGELLDRLRERCSLIIVAGSPLGGRGDGASQIGWSDVTLLVLGARHVHLDVARRSVDITRRESKRLGGAVLTERPEPVPSLLYRWI
jgi:uncharacterized protein involved in exopolysaccharide biosynthesis